MKRRSAAITLILALLMMLFSSAAVLAEEDGHGADAHSDSMSQVEEQVEDEEPTSMVEVVKEAVMPYVKYLPYVVGALCGIILIVSVIRLIGKMRKPKYTGKN